VGNEYLKEAFHRLVWKSYDWWGNLHPMQVVI